MAGGKGTRISSISSDIPKPMIQIEGVPVLEREILNLKLQGFTEFIITVSHLASVITDYFGDGSKIGVKIDYYVEKEPLGNAGALFKIRDKLTDTFALINGDAMFDINLSRMVEFHNKKNALATIFTHPNSHPYDSSLIVTDDNNCVVEWISKEDVKPLWYKNRVNAGIHILSPKVLDMFPQGEKVDLDRNILKPLAHSRVMYAYDSPEYVKDMGTPDRYYQVCRDLNSGIVSQKNLKNKQKAIFLDRDGTINKYVGFLTDINQFELIDGVSEAIKKINNSGYLCIVVTNQPVIARGEVTFDELTLIHNKMETLLGKDGAYLDAIYYCPHHPHKGYEGEISSLKIDCDCRKPKPGLLVKAASDFNIDLSQSWIIGDEVRDVECGQNAGCKTAYIGSNELTDLHCDIQSVNLLEAVNNILERKDN